MTTQWQRIQFCQGSPFTTVVQQLVRSLVRVQQLAKEPPGTRLAGMLT